LSNLKKRERVLDHYRCELKYRAPPEVVEQVLDAMRIIIIAGGNRDLI
jgi:hypothetical protein